MSLDEGISPALHRFLISLCFRFKSPILIFFAIRPTINLFYRFGFNTLTLLIITHMRPNTKKRPLGKLMSKHPDLAARVLTFILQGQSAPLFLNGSVVEGSF